MADFELERLCRQYLQYAEHPSRADELEAVVVELGAVAAKESAIAQKAHELRRIWQGPGQYSHELRAAMLELFALLPEEEGISVHVSDSLAMRGKVGG